MLKKTFNNTFLVSDMPLSRTTSVLFCSMPQPRRKAYWREWGVGNLENFFLPTVHKIGLQ